MHKMVIYMYKDDLHLPIYPKEFFCNPSFWILNTVKFIPKLLLNTKIKTMYKNFNIRDYHLLAKSHETNIKTRTRDVKTHKNNDTMFCKLKNIYYFIGSVFFYLAKMFRIFQIWYIFFLCENAFTKQSSFSNIKKVGNYAEMLLNIICETIW